MECTDATKKQVFATFSAICKNLRGIFPQRLGNFLTIFATVLAIVQPDGDCHEGFCLASLCHSPRSCRTAGLKLSEGFTKPLFTIGALCCYAASFYFLSVTLKSIPVGVAYAIWSGLGIVLTTIVGYFLFAQKLPMASVAGIVLIVAGVGIMMASSGH